MMDVVMMSRAEKNQVVIIGGAAESPVVDVMCISPFDGPVTAGDAAAAVAGGDLFEQLRWHGAGGATEVVRAAVCLTEGDVDAAVAQVGGGARW